MKKILFIVLRFYPDDGATSNCLMNICRVMRDEGISVHVMCVPADPHEKECEVHEGIVVHRIMCKAYCAKKKFKSNLICYGECLLEKAISDIQVHHKRAGLDMVLTKKIRKHTNQLHSTEKFDAIIAVCGNFEMARAILQNSFENTCRGLYQVDPYWTNQMLLQQGKENRKRLEQSVYRQFNCVFTTPLVFGENKHEATFDLSRTVPVEFPNVLKPDSSSINIFPDGDKRIKLLFTGYLSADVRNPKRLWELLRYMPEDLIRCYFLGNATIQDLGEYVEDLFDKVVFLGNIPLKECFGAMQQADILVNIGNNMPNQVPSKLFDYISMGKPILNLAKTHSCPTIDYLKNYPLAINIFDDEEIAESAEKMKFFCINEKGKRIPFTEVEKLYRDHTPQTVAHQMRKLIEKNI